MLLAVYATTIFVTAALLFLVQPMFARMVLPLLGGSPAVWNTCLVFYQAALLAGYLYAHATTSWLGARRQAALHVGLVLLPLLVLPIGIPSGWTPPAAANPIPWLLALLAAAVGLPFFAVSTTSPLLQRWFAGTGHSSAGDPYFLYAASNLGSICGLLGYPVLLEPRLRLAQQSRLWTGGYLLLVAFTLACAALLWRAPVPALADPIRARPPGLTARRRLRWVLLALAPSSLMLSATTFISTDVEAIPLLWVIPLAVYLLTFVLVFARRPIVPHPLVVRALPIAVLALVVVLVKRANQPLLLIMGLHLAVFFVAAMVCHGELARDRPPPAHLTEFYLWLAVGGVVGGVLNALVAPLVFDTVAEYPLTLVLACLLAPGARGGGRAQLVRDLALPGLVGAMAAGLMLGAPPGRAAVSWLTLVVPALLCFGFSRRPLRFGLGVGAILLAGTLHTSAQGKVIAARRSFFGVNRVTADAASRFHFLVHGHTLHGAQSLEPARRREPLAYYHPSGPIGQVFAALGDPPAVAVVGLGAGALACYARPGEAWDLYEIDPLVERIARDPEYFTYLRDCLPEARVILGDARLSLSRAARRYDLIVLDAYSSDAIPVHLLTREALGLYLDRLAPAGVLAFHISNQHLDLEPVLADLARDAGLVALLQVDTHVTPAERAGGKLPSRWAVMARRPADLGALTSDARWAPPRVRADGRVWTDDFSSVLGVLRWR